MLETARTRPDASLARPSVGCRGRSWPAASASVCG